MNYTKGNLAPSSTPATQYAAKKLVRVHQQEATSRAWRIINSAPGSKLALEELVEANSTAALDLLANCPALAVLLIRSCSTHKPEMRGAYFRKMLERSWRELLKDLNLPVRPRTIRLLRKIPIKQCDSDTVGYFAKIIKCPGARFHHLLPHLTRITRDTVTLLRRYPEAATVKLLAATGDTAADELAVTWTVGAVRSLRRENGLARGWTYSALSYDQLKLVEGRLHDVIYRRSLRAFPEPPFPGIQKLIEPVSCYDRLLIETNEVGVNFVGGLGEIQEGKLYLYSMPGPTRATVIIRRDNAEDVWRLHPICAANEDTEVDPQTIAGVVRWFCAATASAPSTTKNNVS